MGTMNYIDFFGLVNGNTPIDLNGYVRKIIKLKIYNKCYGTLEPHKCLGCKVRIIEPLLCYIMINDKNKPSYIYNLKAVCYSCFKDITPIYIKSSKIKDDICCCFMM
jgi:hypothetical protein